MEKKLVPIPGEQLSLVSISSLVAVGSFFAALDRDTSRNGKIFCWCLFAYIIIYAPIRFIFVKFSLNLTSTDGKIEIGRYPQGVDGELLPIKWIVVNEDSEKFLLMSEFCLDTFPMIKKENLFIISILECKVLIWKENYHSEIITSK